jgi:Zn-dependent protease/predicted transcriptional regulator
MKWSIRLGAVAGIGIFVHWTFLLLIGWIFFSYLGQGQGTAAAFRGVGFILALFGCVVLHELGHALTARRFGIRTRDITLLPIGGVARLERMPEKPMQEFLVALAGPAVNVVIAAVLFGIMVVLTGLGEIVQVQMLKGNFLVRLMWVNVILVAFNLLPAFPMDGGRVLRALLAARMDRARATAIAAKVGQGMAILFAVFGLFFNAWLMFIALFVYLGAQAEAESVAVNSVIHGLRVRDAMITRFRALSAGDNLAKAIQELLAGSQQDFPVLDGDRVAGILRRNDLVKALAEGGREATVASAMCGECPVVQATDLLEKAFETIRQGQCATLPVLDNGRLVGLLTLENVGELVMVSSALGKAHAA